MNGVRYYKQREMYLRMHPNCKNGYYLTSRCATCDDELRLCNVCQIELIAERKGKCIGCARYEN